jgi:hypothetical protein
VQKHRAPAVLGREISPLSVGTQRIFMLHKAGKRSGYSSVTLGFPFLDRLTTGTFFTTDTHGYTRIAAHAFNRHLKNQSATRTVILSVAKNLVFQRLKILHFVQDDTSRDFFSKLLESKKKTRQIAGLI